MGVKLYKCFDERNRHYGYAFPCPGCGHYHVYWTERPASNGAIWTFNGNMESPTFRASLLQTIPGENYRCHLFVTDGKIQYQADCTHHLAGQVIEMKDLDTD